MKVFVIGGTRSGKSAFALDMAIRLGGKVLFVATASPKDEEMRRRIEEHRKVRPPDFETLEIERGIHGKLREISGFDTILIDCISFLVANIMGDREEGFEEEVWEEIRGLEEVMRRGGNYILVSNEVGMGVVPPYPLGRAYRDILGGVNKFLASISDEVYFLISGMPLKLKG